MELTKKQKLAISYLTDSTTDYVGYGGAAGGGKSVLGCTWLMELAYYSKGKFFIGRDSLKDTRASVLFTFSDVAAKRGFSDYKFTDYGIEFKNGSAIELLDLSFYPYKDPYYDRFGSKEYTCGWIEEAQQTNSLAFEVLKTRVGRWKNQELNIKSKILSTFNPAKNWVDNTFYRPFAKGQETKETKFVYALPTDNPHLPPEYVTRLYALRDEATRQRLLFGNFDYDSDPTSLIDYAKIKNIWTNDFGRGKKYIVCDVARFGSDKAVIMVFDGFVVIELHSFDISKTTEIQAYINAMSSKHSIGRSNIIIDDDGVGGGVVDNLSGVRGFNAQAKPQNKMYYNLKSECGYKLSEMIEYIGITCDVSVQVREAIEQELAQLKTYDNDKDGKLKILPKEKIKENIGRSPDYLDCFVMRMLPEVQQLNIGVGLSW
jgi:phage terminase large subunit